MAPGGTAGRPAVTPGAVVAIRAIAAGGNGVGSLPDGRTVFVPRTAPGDLVELTAIRLHRRHAEARVATLREAAPGRVVPPCPHYLADQCGGCQLQHLTAEAQEEARRRIVGDALRRIGKLDVPDPPLTAATSQFGYRNKITLTYRSGVLGYHRLGAAGQVFAVERCLLAAPPLDALLAMVRRAVERLPADTDQVVLRLDAEGGRHVIVKTLGDRAWGGAAHLAEALAPGVVIWWHPDGGAPRAMAGSEAPWPATVFEQVHPAMARLVRQHAVAAVVAMTSAGALAWDLYAGTGETTVALMGQGLVVESVELDPRAVEVARRSGPDGARREVGDVADIIRRLTPPRVVIVNPPRGGLDARVAERLTESGAVAISYISCDPATLARDLARLASRYRVREIRAFDQFPQTAHVETVAVLERA